MAVCTFDQLLYALRVSVEAANEALRRRRAMHIEAGDTYDQALHVEIPRDQVVVRLTESGRRTSCSRASTCSSRHAYEEPH